MARKIITILLVVILALTMTACGEETSPTAEQVETAVSTCDYQLTWVEGNLHIGCDTLDNTLTQ